MEDTSCSVGVLVDKDFEVADRIIIILQEFNDLFLISFAERFIQNNNAKITLFDSGRILKTNMIFNMAVDKINAENPKSIEIHESHSITPHFIMNFNLVLISTSGWKDLTITRNLWLGAAPSILILKQGEKG